MEPPPAAIPSVRRLEIETLFESGLTLKAYAAGQAFGPLQTWRGAHEEVLAGRLAMSLGAPRSGYAIHLAAARRHPRSAAARYYHARAVLGRQGPLRARSVLTRYDVSDGAPEVRADWLALHAQVLGHFRDFTDAEHWLQQAEAVDADHAWIAVQRSHVLEMQDRFEEALTHARRALTLRPFYRAAVLQVVDVLLSLGRADEAMDMLEQAMAALENDTVAARLAALQIERGALAEASRSLDRYEELTPLRDKWTRAWLSMRRAELAWRTGDNAGAAAHARGSGHPAGAQMAERVEAVAGGTSRRVLDVAFVQQHHLTCAPATLASLARFYGRPVDHLALAVEIEYGGTPGYREREWAARNGWVAREFRVTWDVARALIDRALPFSLVTVAPTSAHEQAVVGYDDGLRTFVVRDPFTPLLSEYDADPLIQANVASGPRGLLLLPRDRVSELDGIALPESEAYDQLHALEMALLAHDRDAAERICDALRCEQGGHRLAWVAAFKLAGYDADPLRMLEALDAQLALFPRTPHLILSRLSVLRDLGREQETLEALEEHARDKSAPPVFLVRLAGELRRDARQWPRCRALLDRALSRQPTDSEALASLADLRWDERDHAGAAEAYRFAACIEDKHEGYFRSMFIAARHVGRGREALRFLEERFDELGHRSGQPARTLFHALADLERPREGLDRLEHAIARRADDGDLRLFAADAFGRHGNFERAQALLDAARSGSRRGQWLRTSAALARYRGDFVGALAFWREVVEDEPLSIDAQSEVASLLSITSGRARACDHLAEAVRRFPHCLPLLRLEADWADGPSAAEPLLARLLALAPRDAWARAERSRTLLALGRTEEAVEEGGLATEIEPGNSTYWVTFGQVLKRCGRTDRAHVAFRHAIELWLDAPGAVSGLCTTAGSPAEREQALADIESRLRTHVHSGTGLFAYCEEAGGVRPLERLRSYLETLRHERGELWCAWSALLTHRLEHSGPEAALPLALEATERFPLTARLWLQLADVHQARRDSAAELTAAEQAERIAPGWATAVQRLAEAYRKAGRLAASCELLENAAAREPFNAIHHGYLADDLWAMGQSERALEHVRNALMLDPSYEWAWKALQRWCAALGRPDPAPALGRELVARRAGDARAWLALAGVLHCDPELDERLAALDRAIALAPHETDAYDLKATALSDANRPDEAAQVLNPEAFGGVLPMNLKGRAAWLLAERGDLPGAIDRMERVLDEHPGYYWGLLRLADWRRTLGDADGFLATSRRLVELGPTDALAFGYRALAHFAVGDRDAARADLTTAIGLDPSYAFAADRLLSLALEDGDWAAAEALRQRIPEDDQSPFFIASGVRVDLHAGRNDAALRSLSLLVRHPRAETDELRRALAHLSAAGQADGGREVLLAALAAGGGRSLALGETAVHALADGQQWSAIEELLGRLSGEAGGGDARAAEIACRTVLAYAHRGGAPRATAVQHAARELTVACPQEAEAWLALAQVLQGDESRPERLAAFDKAIGLTPNEFKAYEQKALALSDEGLYEEARTVCAALGAEGSRSLELRGRAAWITWQEGRSDEAVAAMRRLVKSFPDYGWGWLQVAEWSWSRNETQWLQTAADALVRLRPRDAVGYGFRAEAETRAGRPEVAMATLRRALELDPEYTFGLRRLIDLLIENNQLAEPESLLRRLSALGEEGAAAVRSVDLWLATDNWTEARSALHDLCVAADEGDNLRRALAAFERRERADWAEEMLDGIRERGTGGAPMADVWIRWLGERRAYSKAVRVAWRYAADPARRVAAACALVDALVEGGAKYRLMAFIAAHRRWLHGDTIAWGKVGYALLTFGYHRLCCRWMADARQRQGWEPWMLFNAVLAHQALGRFAEAAAVARQGHIVIRHGYRGAHDLAARYEVVVAGEAAFSADAAGALARLEKIDASGRISADTFRLELAKAVAVARAGGPDAFSLARARIAGAVSALPQFFRTLSLRRYHRRAVFAVASEFGLFGRLWAMAASTSWFWRP